MQRLLLATVLLGLIPTAGFTQVLEPPQMKLEWAEPQRQTSDFVSLPAYDPWGDLSKLQVGQKVRVIDTNYKKRDGGFLGFSADALSLRVKGKEIKLNRSDVLMVGLPHSRAKDFLAALLVGALVGTQAWLDAKVDANRYSRSCRWDPGCDDKGRRGPSVRSLAIFAGAGAVAGSLLGDFSQQFDRVIYVHNTSTTFGATLPDVEPGPRLTADPVLDKPRAPVDENVIIPPRQK